MMGWHLRPGFCHLRVRHHKQKKVTLNLQIEECMCGSHDLFVLCLWIG